MRWKSKTKVTINELEDDTGTITADSTEKAKILNRFFLSVFTNENVENIPNFDERYHGVPLQNIHISEEKVKKNNQQSEARQIARARWNPPQIHKRDSRKSFKTVNDSL